MKILVISDIHANLNALKSVVKEAGKVDAVWCLGDLVGYGPDPNECIDFIQQLPNLVCLKGNHDAAALGQIGVESFNRDASTSANWTKATLTKSSIQFLQSLPTKIVKPDQYATLAHGSPRNPVWEYLLDIFTASDNFQHFDSRICLVGHTHVPLAFKQNASDKYTVQLVQFFEEEVFNIEQRTILNPGSVGQPRDHDPRASFALYYPDKNLWESRRILYDFKPVQERILKAGLPEKHAERIGEGW